jgi:hypothetical protein
VTTPLACQCQWPDMYKSTSPNLLAPSSSVKRFRIKQFARFIYTYQEQNCYFGFSVATEARAYTSW